MLLETFDATSVLPEEIGLLTHPVEPDRWAIAARERYRFLADLDADEMRVARCDPRDRELVACLVEALGEG